MIADLNEWIKVYSTLPIVLSPSRGNVLFSNSACTWSFGLFDFARMYAHKMQISLATLMDNLWSDVAFENATKAWVKLSTQQPICNQ